MSSVRVPASSRPPGLARLGAFLSLLIPSCLLAAFLEWLGLPAGMLLGPMIVAIIFSARGGTFHISDPVSDGSQAIIGLMIAPSINLSILATATREPWLFIGITATTISLSMMIGWVMTRLRLLPGTVAVWGSMPGAAAAMVMMARDEGAPWQLVAVMSYLRICFVAVLASLVAALATGHTESPPPGGAWFPPLDALGLAQTVVISVVGIYGGRLLRLPAAQLLGPIFLGAGLEIAGLVRPQLPGWLLAASYFLLAWRIGLGFTPEIIAAARKALPWIAAAVCTQIGLLAGCGALLAHMTGRDLMTAYLAMSPGGVDSVAIIGSAVPIDTPFVASMQVFRFVVVLLIGPGLARLVARRMRPADASEGGERPKAAGNIPHEHPTD